MGQGMMITIATRTTITVTNHSNKSSNDNTYEDVESFHEGL